jgi:toxin YoeB
MAYKVTLLDDAFDDLQALRKSDRNDHVKCFDLFQAIMIQPREGIGHPERLKHQDNKEVWSRRINKKDRIIYTILMTVQKLLPFSLAKVIMLIIKPLFYTRKANFQNEYRRIKPIKNPDCQN